MSGKKYSLIKYSFIILFSVLAVFTSGCKPAHDITANATPETDLKLYVLECGYMDMRDWDAFKAFFGVDKDQVEIPAQANPCFLVVHGEETLLWDAGFSDSTPSQPTVDEHGVTVEMPRKLKNQLADLGYAVEDIDYFAISHLHFDHIGNLPYFLNTNILIQEKELTAALSERSKGNAGYKRKLYEALPSAPRLISLEGEHDVFGDGSVVLIPSPGHTEGSQVMRVNLRHYGPVIISGDALHFQEELESHVMPSFHVSLEVAAQSVTELLRYTEENNAELWIQHDPVQYQHRKKTPEYYH